VKKCFPKMVALVNVVQLHAFAMRFMRTEVLHRQVTLGPGSGRKEIEKWGPREWSPRKAPRERMVHDIGEIYTHSEVCEGILMVRPYFRILKGAVKRPSGELWMSIDSDVVVDYQRLSNFWIAGRPEDQDPETPVRPRKESCLFLGCALDELNQADGRAVLGIMLPNASQIKIRVADIELGEGLQVEAGFLGATYTTKAEKEGEKEEPREIERT